MTTSYAQHVSTRQTPQCEPIPNTNQVANSAGGFSFAVDDWSRLDRFLVLGGEGGSYYASERKLTKENAACVLRCAIESPARAVARVTQISEAGRAPKNDPAVFALALLASASDADPAKGNRLAEARSLALHALPRVCRTGTHLFQFAEAVNELRGWGRGLRSAVADWYLEKPVAELAYQVSKYQQRGGWSHRDLLRLSHPKATGSRNDVLHWAVKGWPGVGEEPHPDEALLPIWAFERAKDAASKEEIVRLIRDYRLVRECIPTKWLTEAGVWGALLERMPLTALVRNLATMTRVGLLAPLSAAVAEVARRLADREAIKKARVHPLAMLAAMKTYAQGHGERGGNSWTPVPQVIDALDAAFYLAFDAVEPTGKRQMLALDVSGSMVGGQLAGMPGVTPRIGSAAMALVTASVESDRHIVGFSHRLVPLAISPRQRLDDAIRTISGTPMGGTDCALPMLHALREKMLVDTFVVYTDSETWCGSVHPSQALREYRDKTGIAAKLVVVGMVSNGFTVADPNDAGMMDVVGFDSAAPAVIADFARD